MSTVTKATAERHQRILLELLKQPGNEVCADCRSRNPRWASWNLGIFICVKCAGIHRKLGTHITKVKSLTLDSWTKEQVQCMKQFGNIKSNQIFNPNEAKNPPPTDFEESERDCQLERYIRKKYETKGFQDKPGRRNESIGSSSRASISSGVSFSMSDPSCTTHSPASSIYQQPGSCTSLPFRSPSAASSSQPPTRQEVARIATIDKMLPSSRDLLQSCQLPLVRASTAPIPSHAPSTQSIPPLPTAAHNIFQTTTTFQPRKQESLPFLPHPSLNIHSHGNQYPAAAIHNAPQAPRRDGVWGDLMQLTDPNPLHPTPTPNVTNPYQHHHHHQHHPNSTFLPMTNVGINPSMDGPFGQSVTPNNNPFSSQTQPSNVSFHPSNPFVNHNTSSKNPFLNLSSNLPSTSSSTSFHYSNQPTYPTPFF